MEMKIIRRGQTSDDQLHTPYVNESKGQASSDSNRASFYVENV
jgi:hypothetical protein